jgi:hypothetical protein
MLRVINIRQIEIHAAEPLLLEPSPFEFEFVVAKLKSINHQVLIKFWQNRFKQEVKHYGLRSKNSSVLE